MSVAIIYTLIGVVCVHDSLVKKEHQNAI